MTTASKKICDREESKKDIHMMDKGNFDQFDRGSLVRFDNATYIAPFFCFKIVI